MARHLSERVARLERTPGKRKRLHRMEWLKHVNVVDFLENFEIANISQSAPDQIQFSCPFPGHSHGDLHPSAFMNNGVNNPWLTTYWKCWGCGRQGNAVDFVEEHDNVSRQVARKWVKEHYAPGYIAPKYGSISREFESRYKRAKHVHDDELKTLPTLGLDELKRFDVDWSYYAETHRDHPDVAYMLDRGFTPGDLDEWGIGYDLDSERITIPVLDQDGKLVGFKGRAWREGARPKYLVLGDKGQRQRYGFRTYDKSLVVFGLDKCSDSGYEHLVLCEGEIDVMSMWIMGYAAISCGSAHVSVQQAKLIRQYCDEVVLFFDADAAGDNALYGIDKRGGEHQPGIIELLEPFVRVRVVRRHKHDPNDYLRRGERERVGSLVATARSSYAL